MARPLYMKIVTEIQGVVHAAQLCFATITAICQTNAPAAAHLLIIASTNRIDLLRPPEASYPAESVYVYPVLQRAPHRKRSSYEKLYTPNIPRKATGNVRR